MRTLQSLVGVCLLGAATAVPCWSAPRPQPSPRPLLTPEMLQRTGSQGTYIVGERRARKNLSRRKLSGARFAFADLRGARIQLSDLSGADLSGAQLSHADLSGALLRGTNLRGATLFGANLTGADLTGARLQGALYDGRTRWPAGFDPARHGATRVEGRGGGSRRV